MDAGLAQLAGVAMGLVGLVSVVKARRGRRNADKTTDTRLAERMEMERRMGSYLAARDDTRIWRANDERR